MKFQNRSIHGSKVNRRTDRQTDRQTDKPKAICPSNFVGGIKNRVLKISLGRLLTFIFEYSYMALQNQLKI